MVDVFAGERRRWIAPTLTLLILAGGAAVTAYYANVDTRVLLFGDSYVADPLAVLLKLFGFMTMAVALLYSREYLERRGMMRGEYYVLALTALLGIFVMVSANSLLTVYIGVELMSLSLYAMVAFDRDSGIAAESAMKYFLLGAIASGMLLYGMSLIYGLNGTLNLDDLAAKATGQPSLGVILGLVFIVVAIAFKFGAVPFHMWVPDVYSGAPTAVTLFLSTVPKIASFAFAFRLLAHGMGSVGCRVAGHAGAAGGVVDGVRQPHRHRAVQPASACWRIRPSATWASSCWASSPALPKATRPRCTTPWPT